MTTPHGDPDGGAQEPIDPVPGGEPDLDEQDEPDADEEEPEAAQDDQDT